jgi:hypothetical protein
MLRLVALWKQALVAVGAFAAVSALAEALGAANLGTALGIGQIAFAIAVVGLLLWA